MNPGQMERLHSLLYDTLKKAKKERKILPEHALVGDLGMDSIYIMELIGRVEDEFDVLIPLNKIGGIKKVKDLYEALDMFTAKAN